MLNAEQRQFLRQAFRISKNCGGNFAEDDRLIRASEILLGMLWNPAPPVTGELIAELKKLREEVWQC
jgi:hypothetical protein